MSSSQPSGVVCAGIVVADHLCTPIDHLPRAGELVMADDLVLNLGGCASNAALALLRLGIRARLCGKVGDDIFGRFVADFLSSRGADVSGLSVHPRLATSQTLIVNVQREDRRFIHSFGANRAFAASDIEALLETRPKVLYVGGYLIMPGLGPVALGQAFEHARRNGTITVLDVACPGPSETYLPQLEPVLPHTDVFLPNSDEAALILDEPNLVDQARRFHDLGARHIVITNGDHGAVSWSDELRVRIGTYPVTYVDGTGSGDAFDAGYIAGLLEDASELDCLKLASAMGASCVRAVGASAGLFTRSEASAFIAEHELPVERLDYPCTE